MNETETTPRRFPIWPTQAEPDRLPALIRVGEIKPMDLKPGWNYPVPTGRVFVYIRLPAAVSRWFPKGWLR